MLLSVALVLALAQSQTHLAIEPWAGKDLATSATTAAKYKLTVSGAPKSTFSLEASNVANGWLAAFCTPSVCAPQRVTVTLPSSGTATYQFELIRENDDAASTSGATITGGNTSIDVPPAHR